VYKFLFGVVIALALFCSQGGTQVAKPNKAKDRNMFADNQCLAKGGIGILEGDLYVFLKSNQNKLLLPDGTSWTGKDPSTSEVVIFFDNKVWSPPALPTEFDISKAIVISFERAKVRFFNFSKMSGGYYVRPPKD